MPATTNVNFRTVVHEKSGGMAMFFPDVCKTPAPPAPFVPIPYPNIAMSSDTDKGSSKVKIDGCPVMLDGSNFKTSTGDEAGTAGGGIVSSKNKGKAEFILFSFDVKIEGKGVPRLGDLMLGNKGGTFNTPPMPEVQGPLIMIPPMDQSEDEDVEIDALEESDPEGESNQEDGGGDRGNDAGGTGTKPAEKEKEAPKEPKVKTIKWSKAEVVPAHEPAPVPEECKVSLQVELENVDDGAKAKIRIRNAASGSDIPKGKLENLEVKGGKIVDTATGKEPEWVFTAEHKLWSPWDKPFYYFAAEVEVDAETTLKAETPKDFVAAEANVLRLAYWHACVSDQHADTNDGLTTVNECTAIAAILTGLPHHKAVKKPFNSNPTASQVGEVMANTYVYHQASHGTARCRTEPAVPFSHDADKVPTVCPNDNGHKGRSVVKLGTSVFGDAEFKSQVDFPSVPKALAYLNTCKAGWDPSLAKTLVSRGTRNVVAFRKSIPDTPAVNLANAFYKSWCNVHKADPSKIPEVFFAEAAAYYGSMRPVLYGKGGGQIKDPDAGPSALETAAIVIGAIALGAAIGFGIASLLK